MSCVDHLPILNWYSSSSPASTSSASSSTSHYTRRQQQQLDSFTPATSVGSATSAFLRQAKEEVMSPPAQSSSQFPPPQHQPHALPPLSSLITSVSSSPRSRLSNGACPSGAFPCFCPIRQRERKRLMNERSDLSASAIHPRISKGDAAGLLSH